MKIINVTRQTAAALIVAVIAFTGCGKDDAPAPVSASGVSLNKTELTLNIGASETLTADVAPDGATDKTVSWTSSNPAAATVDASGKITAVNAGTATITATTKDGGKTAVCTVTVTVGSSITMTTAISGAAKISLAGSGITVIDWGDGTAPRSVVLSETSQASYTYSFSGTAPRTITINGENITHLKCDYMQLTALDVSKNTALTDLRCYINQLTALDVTKNTALTRLDCGLNQLTALDVSQNTALIILSFNKNQLTNLDVSKNTALMTLSFRENRLTALDVSKNTALTDLSIEDNQFTAEGLNALFKTLHTNAGTKQIFCNPNLGYTACDKKIATAKGWTVN